VRQAHGGNQAGRNKRISFDLQKRFIEYTMDTLWLSLMASYAIGSTLMLWSFLAMSASADRRMLAYNEIRNRGNRSGLCP